MSNVIAVQGEKGSFSHIAAQQYFGSDVTWYTASRFREIFELVTHKECRYGVIPIENSLAGSVHENYDLLGKHKVYIVAEAYLRVEHHLLMKPGAAFDSEAGRIAKVYSHPKALEQCQNFLDGYPEAELIAYSDTARAARYVAQLEVDNCAAIGSREAAQQWNLDVRVENIEDNSQNYTRFFVIGAEPQEAPQSNLCSIVFAVSHQPGSLFDALRVLADEGVNLSKIESRPIHGRPFEYNFYVDFEFPGGNIAFCREVLHRFKQQVHSLKQLGVYCAASRAWGHEPKET